MSKTDVIEVLDKVPESVLSELYDYALFLIERRTVSNEFVSGVKRQGDVMLNAQESALSALWDTPEEDEAWAYL